MLFGALWPLGGASGRSFVALQAPGNQKEASGEPNLTNMLVASFALVLCLEDVSRALVYISFSCVMRPLFPSLFAAC